ncbi:response regulator [Pseudomonas zeae]|uniref:response regulator n=1 Tax=Pseudomonas zeae TaxID=2745510 RepID=UPI0039E015C5
MKLLVVEDEALVRQQLQCGLSQRGHAVEAVASAEAALVQVAQGHYDLALIDLGLPGMSGLALIRQLRASGQRFPILILSARCTWQDKVAGLNAGADDYQVKPFQFDELEARLTALLHRSCGFTPPILVAGPLVLNLNRKQAVLDAQPLALTAYEYRILEYLMRHQQDVVAKGCLLALNPHDSPRDRHGINMLMDRLLHKLEGQTGFKPIDTVHGQGYRFMERCT